MPTLSDRLIDRSTRREALEIALLAHAVLNTVDTVRAARGYQAGDELYLSPAGRELLGLIIGAPAAARASLTGIAAQCGSTPDAVQLAATVERVTVADLAGCGPLASVLSLLEDAQRHASHLPHRAAA